ncbi:MAG: hypothetical protein HPY62_01440 [Bacteroidales bacterium]|nr:hypothetical protein [Bacteroidales bacterium]
MKKIVFFFIALLVTLTAAGQPDFSGSWKLNTGKSKLGEQFSMAPSSIIIKQQGNDFMVEKHSSFQDQEFTTNDKLTLDGKECINAGFMDSQKKSTAVWSDDKTSLKVISKIPMGDGGEITITEIYKMNGSNMVIESVSSSSFGDMSETMVYDKQ